MSKLIEMNPSTQAVERATIGTEFENAEQQIRRRAYELYEERGRLDGHDQEDWARAEREIVLEQAARHRAA